MPAITAIPSSWDGTREIGAQRPISLAGTALKLVNLPYLFKFYSSVLRHAAGRITPEERTYIPASEFGKVFWRARIYLLIYLAVIGLAIATRSILPLLFIGLPNLYGAWLHGGLRFDSSMPVWQRMCWITA